MDTKQLQVALRDQKLYDGDIDGKWGPLSQAAFDKLIAGYAKSVLQSPQKPSISRDYWTWDQSEGVLYRGSTRVSAGYSGKGQGRNNPAMEKVVATGPIPAGEWSIGKPRTSARTGPHVLDLTPVGHRAHGRSAFQIHGDNKTGDASSGCIILPRAIREKISSSGENRLLVVP